MNTVLTLEHDVEGALVGAAIDGVPLQHVVSVTQSLARGKLRAVITADFDEVENTDAEPSPVPGLEAVFAAGNVTGTTKATATASAGNHLAYKISTGEIETPDEWDIIEDATRYTSGANISGVDAVTNKYVGLYELDAQERAKKFVCHVLTEEEIAGE